MGRKILSEEIAEKLTQLCSQLKMKDSISYDSHAVLFFYGEEMRRSVGMAMFPISARAAGDFVEITYYPVMAFSNDWTDKKNPVGFLKLASKTESMWFKRQAALVHLRELKKSLHIPKEFVITIGE